MLDADPLKLGSVDKAALAARIDACLECSPAYTACADACQSEPMVELTRCIRTNLASADVSPPLRCYPGIGYDANTTRAQRLRGLPVQPACGDACARHASMRPGHQFTASTGRCPRRAADEVVIQPEDRGEHMSICGVGLGARRRVPLLGTAPTTTG